MGQDLKKIIRQEYLKCAKEPAHFMKKYCFIQHPQRGRVLFNLYPFQEKVLGCFENNDYSIINKSRQLGISTLCAGYSLWLMLFHKDKNVLCIATKQETARNMVTKVKFMFDNLPSWLKITAEENNKLSLRLKNGSQIKATSASSDAGRSEAVSLLLIDEAAFIEQIGEIWASAQQTLATGGGAIVLSTPYGTGNWFHKTFVSAESKENDFLPIRLPWFVHPERDQTWRDRQDELLGDPRMAAQECDCDFSTSGDIVFYSEWLEFIKETTIKNPMERRGVDQNLWIWEPADYSREYMVVADVARGDGKDYSACHVMDIQTNTQIAEYKGQMPPKEFGYFLTGLATEYNNAMLVVENANIGWNTIQVVIDKGYQNLYYSPKGEAASNADAFLAKGYDITDTTKMVPGFTMSMKTRPMTIGKLDAYLRDKAITIQGKRTLEEMKTFIWMNGKPEAQIGYNDDLVMSLATGCYVRDTALKFAQQGLDITRAAVTNWQRNAPTIYTGGMDKKKTGWTQDLGDKGQEDLTWLL